MQSHRSFLVTKCLGQVCVWSAICSKIHYAKLKQLIPAKPRPGGFKWDLFLSYQLLEFTLLDGNLFKPLIILVYNFAWWSQVRIFSANGKLKTPRWNIHNRWLGSVLTKWLSGRVQSRITYTFRLHCLEGKSDEKKVWWKVVVDTMTRTHLVWVPFDLLCPEVDVSRTFKSSPLY